MLNDINQKVEVLEFLEAYAKRPVGFLLLSGRNGTGKTYAAMEIYRHVTPYKLPAYDHDLAMFTTQVDLNTRWMKLVQQGDTTNLLDQITRTRLLVLDDLGTRIPTEAFMDFLYAVADKRYSEMDRKGTIITTNLNSSDMRDKFGDAFVSRVGSGQCFRFEGQDRRYDTLKTKLQSQGCIIPLDPQEYKSGKENPMATP